MTAAVPMTDRGRRTRETLLVAGRRVLEERGFAGTRMQDIAEAAGVSHGTVYTWFPTKGLLLEELADAIARDVLDAARGDRRGAAPYERLHEANRRFLLHFRANARLLAVVEEAASVDPVWRDRLDGMRQVYVDRARRTVERLRAEGAVAADVVPATAATALTGMVETFARRSAPGLDLDAAADQITRLWARAVGLTVPEPSPHTSR
jgi:AcrR family transcriptional regulator